MNSQTLQYSLIPSETYANLRDKAIGTSFDQKLRACDVCRQRKIKCDRNIPCKNCKSSFAECSYTELNRKQKRKRDSSEHIRVLESRLNEMEQYILSSFAGDGRTVSTFAHCTTSASLKNNSTNVDAAAPLPQDTPTSDSDAFVDTHHSIDEDDNSYQGYSADRAFVQRLKHRLGDRLTVDVYRMQRLNKEATGLFVTIPVVLDTIDLPPQKTAHKLVEAALNAHILLPVLHRPSFDIQFHLAYSLAPDSYGVDGQRFLPLLFAVLAVGCLVIGHEEYLEGIDDVVATAAKYFTKSRSLINLNTCADLTSLQAIVFMNLYLLFTDRVSLSFTFLSTTLSLALRMGLHRSLNHDHDVIEREVRKRLFWTLRLLSNHTATASGMPRILNDADIDQKLPSEIDDGYIERTRFLRQPDYSTPIMSGANAYQKLHIILDRVISQVYPVRGMQTRHTERIMSYAVHIDTVRGIEEHLSQWAQDLPDRFRLGKSNSEEPAVLRAQYMLAISFCHVKVYLYRPFLQHSPNFPIDLPPVSKQHFSSYSDACINACKSTIFLAEDMLGRGLLYGCHWAISYIVFSASVTLLYVLDIVPLDEADIVSRCLVAGKKILSRLAVYNTLADRGKVVVTILMTSVASTLSSERKALLEADGLSPNISQNCKGGSTTIADEAACTASLAARAFNLSSISHETRTHSHPRPPPQPTQTQIGLRSADNDYQTAEIPLSPPETHLYPYNQIANPPLSHCSVDPEIYNQSQSAGFTPANCEYPEVQPPSFPSIMIAAPWNNYPTFSQDEALRPGMIDHPEAELLIMRQIFQLP